MNPITKELLEKYNIHEHDEEMFYMDNVPHSFAIWPLENDRWALDYHVSNDGLGTETLDAHTVLKTEEDLINALKFCKLYKSEKLKYCSLCPLATVYGPYWNPYCDEDDYDVICTKLGCKVHEELHWTECAAKNSNRTGLDTPPENCPLS